MVRRGGGGQGRAWPTCFGRAGVGGRPLAASTWTLRSPGEGMTGPALRGPGRKREEVEDANEEDEEGRGE